MRSWLRKFAKPRSLPADSNSAAPVATTLKLVNPVENYYRHKIKTNLPVFYRFALQTRSLMIRDVFAKAASKRGYDLTALLAVLTTQTSADLDDESRASIAEVFDSEVLLTLANLLANTARDDLDTHSALQIYDFVYRIYGNNVFQDAHKLQYVEALGAEDRHTDVRHFAKEFEINSLAPLQEELLEIQRIRQKSSSDEDWLDALNELYGSLGMTKVRLSDDTLLPLMDRLMAVPSEKMQGPKVSVIMPTFSPGPGIKTAVRSLLQQTWTNFEIIVVDDASPSEFKETYTEVEQMDPRIRVVHHENNAGAYVARNTGLLNATGEFITTHDDDDWSHPDKLATQVQSLLENEMVAGVTSAHIRTSETMEFQRVNMHATYMQMNYSSLMFRRGLVEEIGPWDTVNRGGDSEFLMRLIEYVGSESVMYLSDRPLSFSRVWSGSLTSGEMSRGYFSYSRLLYRWAFRQWHWNERKQGKKAIKVDDAPRPYAIPTTFAAGQRDTDLGLFDLIYVTDFFRQARFSALVVREMETLSELGFRIGYMHLYSPETNSLAGILPQLFELQKNGKITQVSFSDIAETRVLLVYNSAIGMFLDGVESKVTSQRGLIVDHKQAELSGSELRTPSDLKSAIVNLQTSFHTTFEVVGATLRDHNRLMNLTPANRVLKQSYMWHLHLREELSEIEAPQSPPVVGFHSYGNQYRWPNDAQMFRSIFSSTKYKTRLYGHLESAIDKYGREYFQEMELITQEQQSEREFLESIDFWVYWPHSRLEDEIWEPVLSAMIAGKVVILPSRLERIYGDSAVYSTPEMLESHIESLSRDRSAYILKAERGQEFVQSQYLRDNLYERVLRLLGDQN